MRRLHQLAAWSAEEAHAVEALPLFFFVLKSSCRKLRGKKKEVVRSPLSLLPMIVVEGSLYTGKRGEDGDFNWMHKQSKYDDALFVSLENVVDMMTADKPGGGSACLRDKAFYETLTELDKTKCSVGIPTGWSKESGGFTILDVRTRSVIDNAFDRLCRVLQFFGTKRFARVIYPCDETDSNKIGTRIFKGSLASTVIDYISMRLHAVPDYVRLITAPSLRIIYRSDLQLLPHALQVQKIKVLEWQLNETRKKRAAEAMAPKAPLAKRTVQPSLQRQSMLAFSAKEQ